MKTVGQALVDEVHIPIPYGFVENACIKRDIDIESEFTGDVARSDAYKGTLADCLLSLIQAVSFSEAFKSIVYITLSARRRFHLLQSRQFTLIADESIEFSCLKAIPAAEGSWLYR